MLYLNEFDVYKVKEISKPSLDLIQFELSPFRYHLLCLQSIINSTRIVKKSMKEVKIIRDIEVEEEKVEVDVKQRPGMKRFQMQKDNKDPEWELVDDDLGYIIYPNYKDLKKRKEKLKMNFERAIIKIENWWKSLKIREAIHRYIHILQRNRQSLQNYNPVRSKVSYHNIRLPEDPLILRNYVKDAAVLEIHHKTGKISQLKLLRLMIKEKKMPQTGCFLKAEFPLINYQNNICKVYKRFRWEILEKNKQIVTDWKIKVIQNAEPQSEDYIVVRRLPCPPEDIESYIQGTLSVIPNRRVIPNTILHLSWKVKGIILNSQKYYDLNSSRLKHEHHNTWYLSQYPISGTRIPSQKDLDRKYYGSFYEVYIQKMIPKYKENKPTRYRTQEYLQLKEKRRSTKYGQFRHIRRSDSPSSSESEDDNLPEKYQRESDSIFWNEQQLIKMQLDEVTEAREYFKITLTRTSDKQDSDFFRIEKDIVQWPHPDVEYQYILENLSIKQVRNDVTGDYNIEVIGLRIRNNQERFISDEDWFNSMRENEETELFMAQDEQRWRNQNFTCTVYNTEELGGGFLIESINIDKPLQRAYQRWKSLVGMRGNILKFYLDENLRILGQNLDLKSIQEDQLMQAQGLFEEEIIKKIYFISTPEAFMEKLNKNPNYLKDRIEEKKLESEREEKKDQEAKEDKKTEKIINASIWAKFKIQTEAKTIKKKVDLLIEIKRYVKPAYFKITISNLLNSVLFSDTVIVKLLRLPDPLKARDKDMQKIRNVFQQKLKIDWQNPRKWLDQKIPLMQDAYIDNTIVREEVIHKIVEVKEWGKFYKKKGNHDSSDSEELEVQQEEQILIQQDIQTLKQLLNQLRDQLKNTEGGLEKWYQIYDRDGVGLQNFKQMLLDLKINIDIRFVILMYLVFDRSYAGFFSFKDFEDIILKRIKLNFKAIVFKERQRFKTQGAEINFQKKKLLDIQNFQQQVNDS